METHNFRKAEIASWSVEGVLGYPGSRMWTYDSVTIIWLLQGPYIGVAVIKKISRYSGYGLED